MSILTKHLAFVNAQGEFHTKAVDKYGPNSWRGKMHLQTAEKFAALMADLDAADKLLDTPQAISQAKPRRAGPIQLSLNMEDVANLPDELIQELNLTEGDKTEFAILNAIEDAGGIISLDRLLISLYRRTNEIHKRATLTSRLYRMMNKNVLYSVPGKKGVYSTDQITSDESAKLFGGAKDET